MLSLLMASVWSWAIIFEKRRTLKMLKKKANESQKGFLLNHLISEELPASEAGEHLSNSDPVTGQAGWYDVRVKVYPASSDEPEETFPQFKEGGVTPGTKTKNKFISGRWLKYFAGSKVNK